jgi:hypothetical protein
MGPLAPYQRGKAMSQVTKDTTTVFEKSTIYLRISLPRQFPMDGTLHLSTAQITESDRSDERKSTAYPKRYV